MNEGPGEYDTKNISRKRGDIMAKYIVHLRYYYRDPLEEITQEALNKIKSA